jgi:rsbT antagonist protein RsbS
MSTDHISVLKVREALLVTVPPDPEDATVAALQEQVLRAMERHAGKGLVLDLSGVETVDSYFARTITETAQMVGLMGGRTVLAGMRPSVAMTTVQLGLLFPNALTALDVDRALDLLATPEPDGRRP